MRLDVHRNGVKLFFVTLAVATRQPVLSRVTHEDERPHNTEAGEVVRALWRLMHRLYPALTASDYVIMPDHVHLLLIVDYRKSPDFNPLVFTRWFKDETARLINSTTGGTAPAPRLPAPELSPEQLLPAVIAPADFQYPRDDLYAAIGGAGAPPPSLGPFAWETRYWLDLAFDARQLAAIRRYIRLNPARWLWKRAHPDRFVCVRGVKAARLARFAPRRIDGLGNLALLGSPFLFHVRLTLKKTLDEHQPAIDDIVDRARRGMVPVSGFISPGEREALRRLKAEPRARFIRLLPYALPDRYDPSAEDSRELAANRLAILSPFPETLPISSRDILREAGASRAFRANCLALNDFAAQLCED